MEWRGELAKGVERLSISRLRQIREQQTIVMREPILGLKRESVAQPARTMETAASRYAVRFVVASMGGGRTTLGA